MGIPFDIPGLWERVYTVGLRASTDFAKESWFEEATHYAVKKSVINYCFANL